MSWKRWDEILKHTHHGCNILGLLNFLVFFGGVYVVVGMAFPQPIGGLLLLLLVLACPSYDVIDRAHSAPERGPWRFLLPSAGGTLFMVPIWTVYPLMLIGALVALLCQRR